MSHFLNNSRLGTFGLKIVNLAFFIINLAAHLKVIWQSYFDTILAILTPSFLPFNKKRHGKHIITKSEKYPMKFHNVTSLNGVDG